MGSYPVTVVQYTDTNNKQNDTKHTMYKNNTKVLEVCGPYPVFAGYTLAFALQLRRKHGKNLSKCSRRVPAGTIKIKKYQVTNNNFYLIVEHIYSRLSFIIWIEHQMC
jgi:formylglycine-generating enzyme required for sulfatase activity